jgi:hypothetical protein
MRLHISNAPNRAGDRKEATRFSPLRTATPALFISAYRFGYPLACGENSASWFLWILRNWHTFRYDIIHD